MILIKAGQIGRTLPESTTTRSPPLRIYTWTRHLSTTTRMKPLTIRTEVFWILQNHRESQRITETKNRYPLEHLGSPYWSHLKPRVKCSQISRSRETSWWKRPWCRPHRGPCCGRTPWRRLGPNNTPCCATAKLLSDLSDLSDRFGPVRTLLIWNDLKWHLSCMLKPNSAVLSCSPDSSPTWAS